MTASLTPSFNFTASSYFTPYAPYPNSLLFQVDTWQGAWTAATNNGGGAFSGQLTPLQPGVHTLYAYATDGQDSTSINPRSSPLIGSIAAYLFVVFAPSAALSPGSLPFGNQLINTTSASQPVTLTNNSVGPLTISDVAASGDYSASTCGTTLAAGASCTIDVAFTPTRIGQDNGILTVTDDDHGISGSTQTVSLTGTGTGPVASMSTPSLRFGNQDPGTTSAPQPVTLSNTGTAALSITGITTSAIFGLSDNCGNSLAPSGSCAINVTFSPTAPGPFTGTLTITDDSSGVAGSTQTVRLTGTGTGPVASVSTRSLTFGNQNLGTTSASQPVTLSNTGYAALNITGIATSSNFGQTNNCGSSVAASGSCTINITFSPTATGPLSGTLTITDNSNWVAGSTQTATLTGTGTAPLVSVSPPSLTFGNQNVGTKSGHQSVILRNTGTGTLTIAGIATSTNFGQNNNCAGSVAAGHYCTINVSFAPTATGALSGTLTITDDSNGLAGSTQTVSLAGTGLPAIAVTLSPPSASVALGGTQVFTATISNTTNTALNWYVNGVRNGNAAQGTLTACSTVAPLTCTYTPPAANVPTPNPAIIKVASAADPTKFQTASVTVTDTIAVTLSPSSASVALGGTQHVHRHRQRYHRHRPALVRQRCTEWQRRARHADRLHDRGAPDVHLHGAGGGCPQPQPGGH